MFTRSNWELPKGANPSRDAEREFSARHREATEWASSGGDKGHTGRALAGACRGATRMDVERYLDRIAGRIREWRASMGMTLQQVAARSGVAASTIQKVESQQMVPTIAVLFKIARGLGHNPVDLLDDSCEVGDVIHRTNSRLELESRRSLHLTGELMDSQFSTWKVVHEPGQGLVAPGLGPRGEVLILCQRGQLEATVGDEVFTLQPGESLHCKTRKGFGWRAVGHESAEFTVVGSENSDIDRLLDGLDKRQVHSQDVASARPPTVLLPEAPAD